MTIHPFIPRVRPLRARSVRSRLRARLSSFAAVALFSSAALIAPLPGPLLGPVATASAQASYPPIWNQPFEPFTVAGNIHYVGTADLASFLITSDAGHVLIDTGVDPKATHLIAAIEKLGYKLSDVKILLNTQAHYDHAAAFAELKARTGAKLLASPKDAVALESGGKDDYVLGDSGPFAPVKVDERLKDGQVVTLGPIALTARFTPGHTRGATSWTMTVRDKGKDYRVVFASSVGLNEPVTIKGNKKYPELEADLNRTYATLKSLKPDFFFGQHAGFYGLEEKREKQKAGAATNPFIDPNGYREILAKMEAAFRAHP